MGIFCTVRASIRGPEALRDTYTKQGGGVPRKGGTAYALEMPLATCYRRPWSSSRKLP